MIVPTRTCAIRGRDQVSEGEDDMATARSSFSKIEIEFQNRKAMMIPMYATLMSQRTSAVLHSREWARRLPSTQPRAVGGRKPGQWP